MATVAKGGSLEEGAAEEQLGQSKGSSLVEVTTDGVHGWTWALGVRPAAGCVDGPALLPRYS